MAFPWPGGKKEVREPGAKPEFPSALDLGDDDAPAAAKAENPLRTVARQASHEGDELLSLTQRLDGLGQLLDEAKEQVTSYLLHRESQGGADDVAKTLARKLDSLAERLEQGSGGGRGIDQKLDAVYGKLDQLASAASSGSGITSSGGSEGGGGVSEATLKSAVRPVEEKILQLDAKLKEALVQALAKFRESQTEQHNTLGAGVRQIGEMLPQYFNALPQYFNAIQQQVVAAQQHADAGLRAIIDILRPAPQEAPSGSTVGGDWQEALLGGELAHNPALNRDKQMLLNGVLTGDSAACGLVGSLLLFRSAAADRMPPLLKDIGEAYYRWQPKTSTAPGVMEKSLVDWLVRACEQAGMANTIELVNPGERFDSARHNASRPGVEIAQVLGWVVLRDNGKVYTKATVAVK